MKRNSVEIRCWMHRRGMRQTDIAHALGLKATGQVSDTINGKRSDRRVLLWLADNGCPIKFLALPPDIRFAA